jgi:hypothetical protein
MARYRIEWREGPYLTGGDTWVVELDLQGAVGASYHLVKKVQVVAVLDELSRVGLDEPGWDFWRAMVGLAATTLTKRVVEDEVSVEQPLRPVQLAPDLAEAKPRSVGLDDFPVPLPHEVSEFAI